MFKNYFKTAFRNLYGNKSYTTINVLGLGVGIAVCLMIFLVIQFETSFDNFHAKKDRIYRMITEFKDPSGTGYSSGVPFPLPRTLRNDFPQLKKVAGINSDGNSLFAVMDNNSGQAVKKFKEEHGVFYTEPEFFDMSVSSDHGCYVLLPENVSLESFNKLFPAFVKKYRPAERAAQTGQLLQSLKEVHYQKTRILLQTLNGQMQIIFQPTN